MKPTLPPTALNADLLPPMRLLRTLIVAFNAAKPSSHTFRPARRFQIPMSQPCAATAYEQCTRVLYLLHPDPASPRVDMGSYDYLWRIKDQFLGSRFAQCYKGPEFYALGPAEQKRRVALYEKRRSDEFWYLMRAYGREIRWTVRKFLGLWPY